MTRIITLDDNNDYIAKDGTVIRENFLGIRYRMGEVLRWAARHGFVTEQSSRTESVKRNWNLHGVGAYKDFTIQCLNRSNIPTAHADIYQTRNYAVFYKNHAICAYFTDHQKPHQVVFESLIDAMLEDRLPALIAGRQCNTSAFASCTRSRTIVLNRAA